MKLAKTVASAIICSFVCAHAIAQDQGAAPKNEKNDALVKPPTARSPSQKVHRQRAIRIDYDPLANELPDETLSQVTSGVGDAVLKQVLGDVRELSGYGCIFNRIRRSSAGIDSVILCELHASMPAELFRTADAEENYFSALTRRLEERLNDATAWPIEDVRAKKPAADQALAETKTRLEQLRGEREAIDQELKTLDVERTDAPSIFQQLASLWPQVENLELQLAGQNARRKAIAEQITILRDQTKELLSSSPAMTELRRVVELREQRLANIEPLIAKGLARPEEVSQAQEQVALARAELAKQQIQLAASAGGDLLAKLNEELVMLAINSAEAQARAEHSRKRLAELTRAYQLHLRRSTIDLDVAHAFNEHESAKREAKSIDRKLETGCRSVRVTLMPKTSAAPDLDPEPEPSNLGN